MQDYVTSDLKKRVTISLPVNGHNFSRILRGINNPQKNSKLCRSTLLPNKPQSNILLHSNQKLENLQTLRICVTRFWAVNELIGR